MTVHFSPIYVNQSVNQSIDAVSIKNTEKNVYGLPWLDRSEHRNLVASPQWSWNGASTGHSWCPSADDIPRWSCFHCFDVTMEKKGMDHQSNDSTKPLKLTTLTTIWVQWAGRWRRGWACLFDGVLCCDHYGFVDHAKGMDLNVEEGGKEKRREKTFNYQCKLVPLLPRLTLGICFCCMIIIVERTYLMAGISP